MVPTAARTRAHNQSLCSTRCLGRRAGTKNVKREKTSQETHIPGPAIVDGHLYHCDIRGVLKDLHTRVNNQYSTLLQRKLTAHSSQNDRPAAHAPADRQWCRFPPVMCGHLARVFCGCAGVGNHEKRLKLRDGLCHVGVGLACGLPSLTPQILRVITLRPAHPAAHMRLKLPCRQQAPHIR